MSFASLNSYNTEFTLVLSLQDEIDALATSRASGDTDSGVGSHEGVLTSLLNEMDGVQELLGVTVLAATNRPNVIVRFYFVWRCQDHFLN